MKPEFRRSLFVVAITCLLPSIVFAALAVLQFREAEILQERGVSAMAEIVGRRVVHDKGGPHYEIKYRYRPDDTDGSAEPELTRRSNVPRAIYDALRAGMRVPLVYDPLGVKLSRLNFGDSVHRRRPIDSVKPLLVLSAIFLVLEAFVFGLLFLKYRSQKRRLEWGSPAPATITEEREYATRSGVRCRVTYTFTDITGATIQGRQNGLPSARMTRPRDAAYREELFRNPTALFDPDDSSKNTLYPLAFVELS